jgi:riboflavin transporter FmnP
MRSFIVACVAAIIIAAVAAVVLNYFQQPVAEAFATGSVRL